MSNNRFEAHPIQWISITCNKIKCDENKSEKINK